MPRSRVKSRELRKTVKALAEKLRNAIPATAKE
jgi:hypothetical protein